MRVIATICYRPRWSLGLLERRMDVVVSEPDTERLALLSVLTALKLRNIAGLRVERTGRET